MPRWQTRRVAWPRRAATVGFSRPFFEERRVCEFANLPPKETLRRQIFRGINSRRSWRRIDEKEEFPVTISDSFQPIPRTVRQQSSLSRQRDVSLFAPPVHAGLYSGVLYLNSITSRNATRLSQLRVANAPSDSARPANTTTLSTGSSL